MDASGAPYDLVAAGDPRTYRDLVTPEGIAWISTYADGLGANKNLVIPRDADGYLTELTALVGDGTPQDWLCTSGRSATRTSSCRRTLWIGTDPNAKGDSISEIHAFLDAGGRCPCRPTDTAVFARDTWLEEHASARADAFVHRRADRHPTAAAAKAATIARRLPRARPARPPRPAPRRWRR